MLAHTLPRQQICFAPTRVGQADRHVDGDHLNVNLDFQLRLKSRQGRAVDGGGWAIGVEHDAYPAATTAIDPEHGHPTSIPFWDIPFGDVEWGSCCRSPSTPRDSDVSAACCARLVSPLE